MIKYVTLLLLFCFSCSSTKLAEPQNTEDDPVNEENTARKDDSVELLPPVIDIPEPKEKTEEAPIVDYPDKEASFPGGTDVMKTWISENLKYPKTATEANTEGKVYVEFTVLEDGSIENVSIMKGVSKEIDIEAKRLVRTMPKWIPGENKGEAVNVRCRIPILFELP
jgi:protein TonB